MQKVKEILESNGAKANSYFPKGFEPYIEKAKEVAIMIDDWPEKGYPPSSYFEAVEYKMLKSKWDSKTSSLNAINLPSQVPIVWYKIIDEFFDYLNEEYPNFKINKLELLNGFVLLHLGNVPPETIKEASSLTKELYDEKLLR